MNNLCYLRALQLRRAANGDGGAPEGPAADGQPAAGAAAGVEAEPPAGREAGKAFTQADVDEIIRKTIARERTRADKAVETARTEAERLATMTAEQRAEHDRQERETKLAAREAEINRRELRATALQTLGERSLPAELADVLDYGDADKCGASIDSVEKVFRAAVQKGVEQRMKGETPAAGTGTQIGLQEQLNAAAGVRPEKK